MLIIFYERASRLVDPLQQFRWCQSMALWKALPPGWEYGRKNAEKCE
jgi:hypothetical protein